MKLLRYYFNATPLFALADWLLGVNIGAVAFEGHPRRRAAYYALADQIGAGQTPRNPYTPSFVINSLISLTIWTFAF